MKRFFLFIVDIIILYLSLYLTLAIRYGVNFDKEIDAHLVPFSILFIFWVLVFFISNLYDFSYLKNETIFYSRFFQTIIVSGTLSIIFFYLVPFLTITPKRNLLIFIAIFSILDFVVRSFYNRLISLQTFKNNTIIVGLDQQSIELAKFIKNNPQLGFYLQCIVNIGDKKITSKYDFMIIEEKEMEKIISKKKVNTIILNPEAYNTNSLIELLYNSLDKKINFYNLSDFYEKNVGIIPLGAINQAWFLNNLSEGDKKPFELLKKTADIILSIIGSLVMAIFLPLIALAIKLDSAGPIFYAQKRIGQYGKTFKMYKFRTMRKDAESISGAIWASKNDSRITKIGKLLRKTRFDEIPQLYNILRGDMSFVGPRAERPEFHDELKKAIPFYQERYLIKPGLTGWAQINHYGASVDETAKKLQYDLFYIKNRSIALDISIVLKTLNIVLRFVGI